MRSSFEIRTILTLCILGLSAFRNLAAYFLFEKIKFVVVIMLVFLNLFDIRMKKRLVIETPASWNTPSSIYVYSVLSDTLISGWF